MALERLFEQFDLIPDIIIEHCQVCIKYENI